MGRVTIVLAVALALGCTGRRPTAVDDSRDPIDAAPDGSGPAAADAARPDTAALDARVTDERGRAPADMALHETAAADMAPDRTPPDMAPADMAPADMAPPDMAPPVGPADGCPHPRSTCRFDHECGEGTCRHVPEDEGSPCVCVQPRPYTGRLVCYPGEAVPGACCEHADCPDIWEGAAVCQHLHFGVRNEECEDWPWPVENICNYDGCTGDDACRTDELCVPAGLFDHVVSRCVAAPCRVDADCDARPGGECRPYFEDCVVGRYGCSYADSPCRAADDCPPDDAGDPQTCLPTDDGDTVCAPVQQFPPPLF